MLIRPGLTSFFFLGECIYVIVSLYLTVAGVYRIDYSDPDQEMYRNLTEQLVHRFDEWLDIVNHMIDSARERRKRHKCPQDLTVELSGECSEYLTEMNTNVTNIIGMIIH